jgi:hypothetical protein
MEQFARRLVPQLSGGRLQVAGFDRGPDLPGDRLGRIVVETYEHGVPNEPPGFGGNALIGANPGQINLLLNSLTRVSAISGCYSALAGEFHHEIIHAMGFYHVPGSWSVDGLCNELRPPVLFHANIAYPRHPGNLDPDIDDFAGALRTTAPSIVTR